MPRSLAKPQSPTLPSRRLPVRLLVVAILGYLSGPTHGAELFTVGSGGTHSSLQSAVDACPTEGCTIQLLDSVNKLPREVWIENKRNLAIERSAALRRAGIRPRLVSTTVSPFQDAGTAANPTAPQRPAGWKRWPVTCMDSTGGSLDAKNPYSTTGYRYNGLVVVASSQDVRLEGLTLDGGSPTTFLNKGIWDCKWDVLFGNVGLNLFHSARVVVRDSEIRQFFAALYISNRNPGGAAATRILLDSTDRDVVPFSRYGAMGDHLIEHNEIHHNTWGVYDETEWDLGSTFRFNRLVSNRNTDFARLVELTSEAGNMAGGFLYVKDVPQAIHRIHNNTIWGSPMVMAHGGFFAGTQHLFYNNVVGGFEQVLPDANLAAMIKDWRQLLSGYTEWIDHNLFEVRDSSRVTTRTILSIGSVTDSGACAASNFPSPCWLQLDTPVRYRTLASWHWDGWKVQGNGTVRGQVGGRAVEAVQYQASEQFPGGGRIESIVSGSAPLDVLAADNLWAFAIPWKSTVQGSPGFLEPDWNDSLVIRTARGNAARTSGWSLSSSLPDRGAISSNGTYPEIWALRSQEPVFKGSDLCYSIRLSTRSGSAPSPSRIARIEAWSTLRQIELPTTVEPPPKRLGIRPLPDSTFLEGQWHTFCLDSIPDPKRGLRFHVTLSRTNGGETVLSETAYFLLANASASLISSSATPRRLAVPLQISWKPGELILQGLADGSALVRLLSLDGRRISAWESTPQAGRLSLPLRRAPEGTSIVVVDQEGRRTSARVVRLAIP